MAQSFEAWWATLGVVTRAFLITAVTLSIGFAMGFIPGQMIIVDFEKLFWKLHLWRPITAVTFFGKPDMGWLFQLAMATIYVGRNEEDYPGATADFIWVLAVVVAVLHVFAYILSLMLLSEAFVMALLWIWCRRHEDAQLTLWFFTFSAKVFPFVWLLATFVLGGNFIACIIGIIAGHLVYFALDVLPRTHQITLIRTPRFLFRWFPRQNFGPRGFDGAMARGINEDDRVHRWGGGRPLGR